MIAVYILLAILFLLFLILVIPIALEFTFDQSLYMKVRFWGIPVYKYDSKTKEEKNEPKVKKPSQKIGNKSKKQKNSLKDNLKKIEDELKQDGVQATVKWLGEIVNGIKKASRHLLKSIAIKQVDFICDLGGTDSSKVAETYGKICASLFPLLGFIESKLPFKKQRIQVCPCFLLEDTNLYIYTKINVSLWRLLLAIILFAVAYLKADPIKQKKNQISGGYD